MEFRGIEDALGKWVIVCFMDWPEELRSPITGLDDVDERWLQFKLRGIDNLGVWLENPYFKVLLSNDNKGKEALREQREALQGEALVLVKWQYIATIIYLGGQQVENIPLGFKPPS